MKVLILAPVVVTALVALSGCAAAVIDPTPAPTVTATVTASPMPRSPGDALTVLDAWLACSAAERANLGLQTPGTVFAPYDASNVKAESDGSYTVQVAFQPPGGTTENPAFGGIATCVVKGTVSEPDIASISEIDAG